MKSHLDPKQDHYHLQYEKKSKKEEGSEKYKRLKKGESNR